MLSKKLSDIANVISGYTFRKGTKETTKFGWYVVQAKDVDGEFTLSKDNLKVVQFDPKNTKAILKKGDILLSARGRFSATVVTTSDVAIASSSVFIIRPKNDLLKQNNFSNFLCSYLNSSDCQNILAKTAKGGSIKALLKSDLSELVIPLPPISTQTTISNLTQNIELQNKILKRIMELNSLIGNAALSNSINK